MTPSLTQINKLLRRSKILIVLTLVAALATSCLMTIQYSPLDRVLLVVQAFLLASQIDCVRTLRKLKEQAA